MIRQIMRIADRYFNTDEAGRVRIWPFRPLTALERRIGIAMVVFLVLINQAQVGIIVRLNFFNRDLFNAIQNHDAVTFWHQLLLVFTPFAFVVCRDDGRRILHAVDARHPLAAMVD